MKLITAIFALLLLTSLSLNSWSYPVFSGSEKPGTRFENKETAALVTYTHSVDLAEEKNTELSQARSEKLDSMILRILSDLHGQSNLERMLRDNTFEWDYSDKGTTYFDLNSTRYHFPLNILPLEADQSGQPKNSCTEKTA